MIKRIVIEVPEEMHRKIKQEALKQDLTIRAVVIALITEWLIVYPSKKGNKT